MWKKAVVVLGMVTAASGCANLTAPDGIQIEGGLERAIAGTCQVAMPDGMMGEKGSEPDLGSCSGIDSRITSGK